MASTNFKLFDENKTNMMSDTEYNINTQRLNGVQAGIASSQLQNKTLYQTSLVAYSLAQIMMQNGYDANDSAAVSAFVGNMSNSLLQKVLDKATSVEAQNGVNNTKWMSPALTKAAIDILAAKAQNILSDETKTLYGLPNTAVPDDALALLSRFQNGLGNEYVWEKSKSDEISYVNSPDPNAYPPAVSDGYTYMPMGQIGAKVQIEIGSYTGTGTYDANNPNSLTFNFEPKLLFLLDYKKPGGIPLGALIFGRNSSPFNTCMSAVTLTTSFNTEISNGLGRSGIGKKSADGKTFYWYSTTSAEAQFNYSGCTYRYMYIG